MRLFFMIALIGLMSTIASAEPFGDIDAFFAQFTEQRNSLRQLEARFVQTTITPDETITSSGSIVYARTGDAEDEFGKRLIFRYDDPELAYMINGQRAYEYDAELKQLQIFDIEDSPAAEVFYLGFDNTTDRLLEAYRVRLLPAGEDNEGGVTLELTPKDPESESIFFEKVELRLRKGDLLPTHIHIVNDAESEVDYVVSDFVLREELEPAHIEIVLPEGTDIIDNEEYVETVGVGGKRVPGPPPAVIVEESDLDHDGETVAP